MTINQWVFAGVLCILVVGGAACAEQTLVSQKGKIFAPDELTLTVGATARIDNDDNVLHNITVITPSGDIRNSGLQKPGEHADVLLDKPGDYVIHCGVHPKMKLVVHAH